MSVKPATVTYGVNGDRNAVMVVWVLANGDTGVPFEAVDFNECSMQATGTFGAGGSISFEGSNDGTTYSVLTDPQGNAITKTSGAFEQIEEVPRYQRPHCTAGDGTTSLTVTVWGVRRAQTSTGTTSSTSGIVDSVATLDADFNIDSLQSIHDTLKAGGGGSVRFICDPGTVYTPVLPLTWDITMVGLDLGRATIDISGIGAGNAWITVIASALGTDFPDSWWNLGITGGRIKGGFTIGTGASSGVTALRFNATAANSANNCVIRGVHIEQCYKALSFHSQSYLVKFYDLVINYNGIGLFNESGGVLPSENNVFVNALFGRNDVHINDVQGNIWRFYGTSFDYHSSQCFIMGGGCRITLTDCHLEFNYGANSGENLTPITLTGASTAFNMRGGRIYYNDSGQNPFWTSLISSDNGGHQIIVKPDKVFRLGRLTDTAGFDTLVGTTSNAGPYVEFECRSDNAAVSDTPAMTFVSDSGVGGLTRNGTDDPYNELAHHTSTTLTAAIARVTASENGVTLKNTKNMLKISGIGKVNICLPNEPSLRRKAWMFFTNAAFVTGSVTIKERVTSYGTKYDGTTVTNVVDTRGTLYAPTTVTLGATADTWIRRSWKDCNTGIVPNTRQFMSSLCMIEIDTTLLTAGALYLSYFAYDLI